MKLSKIIKVLEREDGLCADKLQNGARCVVGALLYQTGEFTKNELREMDGGLEVSSDWDPDTGEWEPETDSLEWRAQQALWREYEIDDADISRLISMNDGMEIRLFAELPEIRSYAAPIVIEKDRRKRHKVEDKVRLELILAELKGWRLAGMR